MNILIGENHSITSDARNIVLNERFAKKESMKADAKLTGEYGWRILGYYPSIDRAINHLITLQINASEAASLSELAQDVQRLRKDIEPLTSGIKIEFEEGGDDE